MRVAIEDDIKALTAVLNKLSDKLGVVAESETNTASASPPPAATAAAPSRGPGRPRKISLDEVRVVANKLSAEKGRPVAVKLISEHGAGQLADIEESKYSSFIAAAELLLKQQPENVDL